MKITSLNTITPNQNANSTKKVPSFQAELRIGKEAKKIILDEWEGNFSDPMGQINHLKASFDRTTRNINGTVNLTPIFKEDKSAPDSFELMYTNTTGKEFFSPDSPEITLKDLLPHKVLDEGKPFSYAVILIVASTADMMTKSGVCSENNVFKNLAKTLRGVTNPTERSAAELALENAIAAWPNLKLKS